MGIETLTTAIQVIREEAARKTNHSFMIIWNLIIYTLQIILYEPQMTYET